MSSNSVHQRRFAAVALTLLTLAASVGVAFAPAGAGAAPAAPARTSSGGDPGGPGPSDLDAKPLGPGAVQIDPASLASGGGSVVVTTDPSARAAILQVASSGGADAADGSRSVPAGEAQVRVPVSVDGAGRVTATLTGQGPTGSTTSVSDTVWTDEVAGKVLVSERGEQDLRLQRVEALVAAGQLGADDAAAQRREILGGTDSSERVTAAACAAEVCVHGTVLWTDSAGATHPVRKAPVQIFDQEAIVDDVLVTTVTTADDGTYSASFDNDDGLGQGGRDVYVRVQAAGPGFDIQQHIDSGVTADVADGSDLTVDLTANNTADNNTAFSVQAALVVGTEYLEGVRGSRFADYLVDFPTADSTSNYSGGKLHVLALDRWDWDVILHEYGHFVADQLDIENNPGGSHSFDENLSDRVGKDKGIRLAFGEGWPTYFGVSLLQLRAAALGVPLVGDDRYQDTEDASIDVSLETAGTLGEDNEVTNMGVLWDLYDSNADAGDKVALGDVSIWNTLDAGNPTTLSAAYKLFAPDDGANSNPVNCIFSELNVAPKLDGPAQVLSGATSPSPTLTWTAGNGGGFKNDKFVVEYRGATNEVLFTSPEIGDLTYTAPDADWKAVNERARGLINVTVVARQSAAPETGKYRSCRKQFLARSLDLVFVIDTTGSMGDDIAAVQAQAAEITNTLLAPGLGSSIRIGLVDYKDLGDIYQARVDVPFTSSPADVVAGLNSLTADGGGDYPESVYSGVMTALAMPWQAKAEKKAIIVMGDAPAQDPEPGTGYTLSSVLAALAAGGVSSGGAPAGRDSGAVTSDAGGVAASVYSVIIGSEPTAVASLTALAEGSGGKAFPAGNASQVVAAILASIEEILNAPVAVANGPYSGTVGAPVAFSAEGSYDPDGVLTTYEWDFDDNGTYDTSSTSPSASHTYGGEYDGLVRLRVTDDSGAQAVATAAVKITGGSQPPPADANAAFVKAAYQDFLGRAPTAEELAAALAGLKDGSLTRASLVDSLARSAEWVSVIVKKMYTDTLGRENDAGGLGFWTRQIQSGRRSVAQVAAYFYSSNEYYQGIGGGTPSSWVTDLYRKLLGRSPDAGGLAYWSAKAAVGREKVAYGFFQSVESRGKRVDALYQKLLGRAPDAAGRAFWVGRVLTDGDIALARDLASSDEYANRAITRFGS